MYETLLSLLSFASLNENYDQSIWTLNSKGIGSFYKYLAKNDIVIKQVSFSTNLEVNAPLRVK